MGSILHPRLPLPPPLRGSDFPSFTHISVTRRLPEIAGRILTENELFPEAEHALRALIAEIPAGKIRPLETPLAPDSPEWTGYTEPYLGMDWLEIPWFFAEHYFYRRVLEATGYYLPGPGQGMDPFRMQKSLGLQASRPAISTLARRVQRVADAGWNAAELAGLIQVDLWGNLTDLSRWPAGMSAPGNPAALQPGQDRVLVDDSPTAAAELFYPAKPSGRVDILLDNVGFELICDLALACVLLESGSADQVQLHVKNAPVFVSDAMEKDILHAVSALAEDPDASTRQLGQLAQRALTRGALQIRGDDFWTSPLPIWEMPGELHENLQRSRFIIAKGDAQYRRLVGDRHWPHTTPLAEVACGLPARLLALRTLKSEVALGLAPGQSEAAEAADPEWMNDGQWGLIQFVR